LYHYVSRLYSQGSCCGPAAAGAKPDEEELKLFEAFIKKRHGDPDATIRDVLRSHEWRDLFRHVSKSLITGVERGYGKSLIDLELDTPDYLMVSQLRENIYFFSAFKNYQFMLEINTMLVDDEGKLREFPAFKREVLKVNDQYNAKWLQTEYNAAVGSAQMAANWQTFQEDKDDYYLEYVTSGDDRVRDAHRVLDGIVLEVDDAFWDTYYPPSDWGCRCDVKQVLRSGAKKTDLSKKDLPDVKPGFKSNAGKTGEIFSQDHPYFQHVPAADKKLVNQEAKKETKRNHGGKK
jgi:SPP1 gp7 family putative phage head morphogenesis protein